jgi:hypothetical protein
MFQNSLVAIENVYLPIVLILLQLSETFRTPVATFWLRLKSIGAASGPDQTRETESSIALFSFFSFVFVLQ